MLLLKLFSTKTIQKCNFSNLKYFPSRVNRTENFKERSILNARDILEHSHGEAGTLQTHFIKYIALENAKLKNIVPKTVKYSQFYPLNNINDFESLLENIDQSQIPNVIIFTSTYKSNADPSNIANVISLIDSTCCEKLPNMSLIEILQNLYSFMYLIPNKVTKFRFYKSCMKKMIDEFSMSQPKEIFVQICYYLGLSKNNMESSKLLKNFLLDFLDMYLDQLNTTDFAIISNAAYKSGIIFGSKMCKDRLVSEITNNNNLDDDLIITFVKSLRLNRIKSDVVIQDLNNQIKKRNFDFKGLCHVFAFFAENNYNETTICVNFINLIKETLRSLKPHSFVYNDVRPKDLATFFWSCAYLRISTLKDEDFSYFESIIQKKINRNEYERNADELIDTCLSLWMLNYKSFKLINEVLKLRSPNNSPFSNRPRIKLESRFKLLINLLQIEPLENVNIPKDLISNCFDERRAAPEYLYKNNTNLNNMYNLIVENQKDLGVKDVQIVQPISELNVAGLFVEYDEDKTTFVEILDENNKLRFNGEPNSIMSLKIKTLRNLQKKVAVIDVENITPEVILTEIQKSLN